MKVLELTEQKAKDLNYILQIAVDKGEDQVFSIEDIDFPDRFNASYLNHLLSLLEQYNSSPKVIVIHSPAMKAIHNTKPFLDSGGFLRILKNEQREETIQNFTLSNLKQSVLGTKEWFKVLTVTIVVAALTTISIDYLSNTLLKPSATIHSEIPITTPKIYRNSSIGTNNAALSNTDTTKKEGKKESKAK